MVFTRLLSRSQGPWPANRMAQAVACRPAKRPQKRHPVLPTPVLFHSLPAFARYEISSGGAKSNPRSNDKRLFMNIYVGNLSYGITEEDLRALFAEFGDVSSAKLIIDRETNRSKGFGFVEMSSNDAANKAIDELNGREVSGRALRVNEARPREERPRHGGGGGRY